MPLIEVTQSRYVSATIRLDSATANLVDQYAAFVHGSADDVVDKALNYVFAKHREFQEYLKSPRPAKVVPSLRVRKLGTGDGAEPAAKGFEIERMKETHFDGSRSGKNFSLDRQTEPLVLDSEISGLENLHAFLKHGNYVTRFSFPVQELPATQPKFIERLKDDFIVRKPKDTPETAASGPPIPSEPSAANPVSEDGQRPFIVHQRNAALAPSEQEQAALPFNTEL